MKRLTAVVVSVIVFGLGLWVGILFLTATQTTPNALLVHLGQTGATLALIAGLGGLVREALKEREELRDQILKSREEERQKTEEDSEFYNGLLASLKSVYDLVERCRLLIEAHQSAKSYGEQVRDLVDGVVTLHKIKRTITSQVPELANDLDEPIDAMMNFLQGLLDEFRDNYKRVSHLQSADEAWNKHSRESLPKEGSAPNAYQPLSRAWDEIRRLPRLQVLRDNTRFQEYYLSFLSHLDKASDVLRGQLPRRSEAPPGPSSSPT